VGKRRQVKTGKTPVEERHKVEILKMKKWKKLSKDFANGSKV
jgi:hypothetical protein